MRELLKKPSAWVPVALSLGMLAFMFTYVYVFGVVQEVNPSTGAPDEGIGAHIFQLWLLFEIFLMTSFAMRWLPRAPKQALGVLALQIAAAFVPVAIVFTLEH